LLICGEEKSCDWADRLGPQVAETPDKETQGDKPPEAAPQRASRRVPAIVVSLSALAVIGAVTASSLPDFNRFSLPNFSLPNFSLPNFSLPNFNHFTLPNFSLPNFNRFSLPNFSLPNFNRFVAPSPHQTASAPIPDPPVSATLKDIQLSQQQNAAVLASLTQSSATQQADLKRISRQLSSLAAQVDALQSAVTPLTTSSIPHSNTRASIRARVVGTSRKTISSLPKPVGPVSVGGAPLSPAPAPGSGAG
jgi:outer membrane murein-binding lipoprotein Lpp